MARVGPQRQRKNNLLFSLYSTHELYFTVNNSRLKIVQAVKIHPVYSVSIEDV